MQALGYELLVGVGRSLTRVDAARQVVHVRRPLTDEEIAELDPAWLALPAIDLAGT